MKSIREEVILEFLARAATLLNTGSPPDYNTNIGSNVLRCQKDVGDTELPCLVVWPQPETAEAKYGKMRCSMIMKVDGIDKYGADPGAASIKGEQILADIIKCFASPAWDRGRGEDLEDYIESVAYQSGGVDIPDAGTVTIGSYVNFIVVYLTAVGDPYNQ